MIILTIRSDKPEAEIGLYDDTRQLAYLTWEAHRQLAMTLHAKIEKLMDEQDMSWSDLGGIACFQGPGSFTGLRIGLTAANTISYSYDIPIVAEQEPKWLEHGLDRLVNGERDKLALPYYGADAHITLPKK